MKVKVSEATGPVLDWMVAKAEGYDEGWLTRQLTSPNPSTRALLQFSTDWAQGGPIIERERISLSINMDGDWNASKWAGRLISARHAVTYPTKSYPLIAAMRCFVASKLGDEVDVPEELL